MAPVTFLKVPTTSPADTDALTVLQKRGFATEDILGIVGKTEGNGCVNDFSRTLSSHVWEELLPRTAISIFSGGTEGVLSPHLSFILSSKERTGLLATVLRTWNIPPELIGGAEHVACVAATVRKMLETERLRPADVQLVLVKCPLLTSGKISSLRAAGHELLSFDTYGIMAYSRYASAVGVGVGLGEISQSEIAKYLDDGTFQTEKASCSASAELDDCQIMILANDSAIGRSDVETSPQIVQQAFAGVMKSAIDFAGLQTVLKTALTPLPPYKTAKLLQVFAKAEADPSGYIEGEFRHTMLSDSDLQGIRHARAAAGGLIAGVTGDCHIYVSGGAEGQGPKGGGGLCVVASWER